VIFDAGYDPMRLAHQLAGLPVEILRLGYGTASAQAQDRLYPG
jgi:hypothetical protein